MTEVSGPTREAAATPLQADFLERLHEDDRQVFLDHCVDVDAARGTVLFEQGQPHRDTFLIDKGLIRTYYLSPQGKEITLAFWADGNLIGAPDMFGDTPHVWSAQATRDTRVKVIDGASFHRLACTRPGITAAVLDTLAFKVHWLSVLFQTFATESVTDRLAHQLIRLSEMHGEPHSEGTVIIHEFTQEDLANMVGATRQWISITLTELTRAGLVRVENRKLIVRDLDGLRQSVQGEHDQAPDARPVAG